MDYDVGPIFEMVPSAGKEVGWNAYLARLGDFLENPRGTNQLLRDIHSAVTQHYNRDTADIPDELRYELETDLYTLDREDGDDRFEEWKRSGIMDNFEGDMTENPAAWYAKARKQLREICEKSTDINLDLKIIGEVRQLGTRSIDGAPEESVFYGHTCFYEGFAEGMARAFGATQFPPTAYYGLSRGIDKAYEALCDKYDEVRGQAEDIDGVLMAESFLQLAGTRLLHPFWDGNGRTFAAHLALVLEESGIRVRDYGTAVGLTGKLSDINDSFSKQVLGDSGVSLKQQVEHYYMSLVPNVRAEHMGSLQKGIEDVISQGISEDGKYFRYYQFAADAIKWQLLVSGLVEPTTEKDKDNMQRRDAAVARNRELNREYWVLSGCTDEEAIETQWQAERELTPTATPEHIDAENDCLVSAIGRERQRQAEKEEYLGRWYVKAGLHHLNPSKLLGRARDLLRR